jgi:hypothetical protein
MTTIDGAGVGHVSSASETSSSSLFRDCASSREQKDVEWLPNYILVRQQCFLDTYTRDKDSGQGRCILAHDPTTLVCLGLRGVVGHRKDLSLVSFIIHTPEPRSAHAVSKSSFEASN